jgi:predicted amidohydrolase YtcJ
MDGALGSRGAALLAPYSDAPASDGLLLTPIEQLRETLRQARGRAQIATHAIGDRGNATVLDIYAEAFAAVRVAQRRIAEPRWRIEHAQIVRPADIPRFAQMGVIASMQPSHAIGDFYFAPSRLGPDRLNGAYAWKSMVDAHVIVAAGSDAPVEKGDPLIEFYAAVARRSLDGFSNADWHPEQAVDRATALKMFTAWPAYAAFAETERGVLKPGMTADVSVFSVDLMTAPVAEIPKGRAVLTMIDGVVAFEGDDTP